MAETVPSKQFDKLHKVLIANRGEIACRIINTCRRLGIATVAVFSDADRNARHVRLADEAVHIGAAAPAESYLRHDRIIEAALTTGAQAIHPGYGFLSENTSFARAIAAAGLTFVGPDAPTIEKMGSKADAKITMRAAGVPCVPGYDGTDQDPQQLRQQADQIGYPILIKASAGGGGKGMRVVHQDDEFEAALTAARREAAGAFGNDHVILERFLTQPRHVEFQIFGDRHGQVVHLFERDCSSQRRYQKVIEESPSPAITPAMRQAMGEAAVAAARAVDYVGAGTVEFIVQGEEFFFMEMNTRLQVEHPVTEFVTGLDLVEWQLRVAAGEPLPLNQTQIEHRGHAVEVRLYAEDPGKGFLPSTGRIELLRLPQASSQVRVDSGVETDDHVTVHYDPMIAKIITWGADRDAALAAMQQALADTYLVGLHTNLNFLSRLIDLPLFRAGQIDTTYLDQHLDTLLQSDPAAQQQALLLAVAGRLAYEAQHETNDPWQHRDGWSNSGNQARSWRLEEGQQPHHIELIQAGPTEQGHQTWQIHHNGQISRIENPRLRDTSLNVIIDGHAHHAQLHHHGRHVSIIYRHQQRSFRWLTTHDVQSTQEQGSGHIVAPMPGKIIALHIAPGDSVSADQALLVMEAMKMEITLRAPRDGTVAAIRSSVDAFVEADTVLVELADEQD